jgi:hypothetical protein
MSVFFMEFFLLFETKPTGDDNIIMRGTFDYIEKELTERSENPRLDMFDRPYKYSIASEVVYEAKQREIKAFANARYFFSLDFSTALIIHELKREGIRPMVDYTMTNEGMVPDLIRLSGLKDMKGDIFIDCFNNLSRNELFRLVNHESIPMNGFVSLHLLFS